MRIEEAIHLPASPETVWDYVQNYRLRAEWDRSVVKVEKLGDGPLGVGGVLRIEAPGFTWDAEYVSFDRPRRSAVKMIASRGRHPFAAMAGSWNRAS